MCFLLVGPIRWPAGRGVQLATLSEDIAAGQTIYTASRFGIGHSATAVICPTYFISLNLSPSTPWRHSRGIAPLIPNLGTSKTTGWVSKPVWTLLGIKPLPLSCLVTILTELPKLIYSFYVSSKMQRVYKKYLLTLYSVPHVLRTPEQCYNSQLHAVAAQCTVLLSLLRSNRQTDLLPNATHVVISPSQTVSVRPLTYVGQELNTEKPLIH